MTIGKEDEEQVLPAGESNSSSPTGSISRAGIPVIDGVSTTEPAELHHAPATFVGPNEGMESTDYPLITNYQDAKHICVMESVKLWIIAGPIAFNILCNYGINSFTNIFVGHLGDLELSAVAISLSVIANFSFGFLVS